MIDRVDQELLLQERVRIPSMTVLESGRLHEADGGEVMGIGSIPKIRQIVLMVRLIGPSNFVDRGWGQVVWVRRRRVVLERFVMRNVVTLRFAVRTDVRRRALRLAIHNRLRGESSLEPISGNSFPIQQITDVRTAQRHRLTRRAVIEEGLRIADDAAFHNVACDVTRRVRDPVGLTRDEVKRARCGRPERRVVAVVAHCEVLRIVPEGGHRIAVKIAHDLGRVAPGATVRGELDELIGEAHVVGLLLVQILVVLIALVDMASVDTHGIHAIGVTRQ